MLKNMFTAISALVIWYFVTNMVASAVQLASASDRIHVGMGQYVFCVIISIYALMLITPLVIFFMLPKPLIPPENASADDYTEYLTKLRLRLLQNKELNGVTLESKNDIPQALHVLSNKVDKVVRDAASKVFLGTAVMQNGRIDGVIVLAAQIRMVWKIAKIYYQRPSPREMLYLYSNVSTTVFLADSIQDVDFLEMATPLVTSVIPSLKGAIPGLQGFSTLLVNSVANGSANALMTLRVGLVAKQYCEATTAPSSEAIRKSATAQALKLVGQITKENSALLVKSCWDKMKWWKSSELAQ